MPNDMNKVNLIQFAHLALAVSKAVIPMYRSKYSKHCFTQPQLLAMLCVMRFQNWTFRETQQRLLEQPALRAALTLTQVPDYSTLYRFMRRLTLTVVDQALGECVRRVNDLPRQRGRRRAKARVAVDSTGLTPGAVSTFFVKRVRDRHGGAWRHWPKWSVAVDVDTQMILSQRVRQGPCNDCALLRPLVADAHRLRPVGLVLADAEFDSERNHRFIRDDLGAISVIPAKRGKSTWTLHGNAGTHAATISLPPLCTSSHH